MEGCVNCERIAASSCLLAWTSDEMIFRGNRSDSVFTEIKTSFRDRLIGLPAGDAGNPIFMFVRFHS